MNKLISVVVVNWNGKHYLGECLATLRAQTYEPREIILVDNGSTDGSADFVAREFPEVRLTRSDRNLGFAAGNNVGFRAARGDYVVTLNADAVPEPTCLAKLARALDDVAKPAVGRSEDRLARVDSPRGIGMVAGRLLRQEAPDTIDTAGICVDRAGIAWDRLAGRSSADSGTDAPPLFGPCAGLALYRRDMLEEIGGFDEDFFLYLEDVDLAWRARLAGWGCVEAAARALHRHSAAAGEDSPLKRYHLARNKLWYIAKCYPAPLVFVRLPVILALDLLAAVGYAIAPPNARTSLASRLAALWGRLAALAGLPRMLVKRRAIQHGRRLSAATLQTLLAPIEAPWRLYRRFRLR